MIKKDSTLSFEEELYLYIFLIFINIFCAIIKQNITKEPFIDASDLDVLNVGSFVMFVFIIPLFEEFLFRGYLCFLTNKVYLLVVSFVFLLSIFVFIQHTYIRIVLFLVTIISTIVLYRNVKISNKVEILIDKYQLILVLTMSFIFGIIHLSNYQSFRAVNLLVVFPKILAGIFFSYLTIKYNIWVSWMSHCINNFIPFIIIYCYSKTVNN